jgi:hypothetical protein
VPLRTLRIFSPFFIILGVSRVNGYHNRCRVTGNHAGQLAVPLREILDILKVFGDELYLIICLALEVDLIFNRCNDTVSIGDLELLDIEAERTRNLYGLKLYRLCL